MSANSSGSRLAPPTSAPSISGWAMNSRMLPGFTLPPYCTRIDYIIASRPELAVLGYREDDLHALRREMVGTPTIRRETPTHMDDWGSTATEFLASVEDVRTNCSGRERPIADLFELVALPDIDRQGDDVGLVVGGAVQELAPTRLGPVNIGREKHAHRM